MTVFSEGSVKHTYKADGVVVTNTGFTAENYNEPSIQGNVSIVKPYSKDSADRLLQSGIDSGQT